MPIPGLVRHSLRGKGCARAMILKREHERADPRIAFVLCIVFSVCHILWAQQSPPKIPPEQIQGKSESFSSARFVPVPDLSWQSRRTAVVLLGQLGLKSGNVTDDGRPDSVVLSQTTAPNQRVVLGSAIDYTVGQPKLVLKASSISPEINQSVHLTVELVPKRSNVEGIVTTYTFKWRRNSEDLPAETTNQPQIDHTFEQPGAYSVVASATIGDRALESETVEIRVPKPVSKVTPTPTSKRQPSPGKTPAEPARTPAPPLINWPAVLKAVVLALVMLGTLMIARWVRKRRNADKIKPVEPAAPRLKISTGNRQITSKITQPESLKSRCLTRVRWVRGPSFSRMSPKEQIVKKKGAAHG